MNRFNTCLIALLIAMLLTAGCRQANQQAVPTGSKVRIVTTLFPLYDFARSIGKDKAEVILLLPPGMEPHSFEPKPEDMVRINKADIFVYTNEYMEPWAVSISKGLDSKKVLIVDASKGLRLLPGGMDDNHASDGTGSPGHQHHGGMDPHLWLDFSKAQGMVDTITTAFISKDPKNKEYYTANALAYKVSLAKLDEQYRQVLATCSKRLLLHGGHFAFGYLAARYGLTYQSAYSVSADAEPTPGRLTALIKQMQANGLKYIFTEELIEPRIATTIAGETGATILMLHAAHNISREELARGVTFRTLMEQNLANLRIGLQCR